jgi:hypothetical protein
MVTHEEHTLSRSSERRQRAVEFVDRSLATLKATPFATLANRPEFDGRPNDDLDAPDDLAEYKFTLMKDTLSTKEIRIAIQAYRGGFPGFSEVWARGFAISSAGFIRPLTDEELRDLA